MKKPKTKRNRKNSKQRRFSLRNRSICHLIQFETIRSLVKNIFRGKIILNNDDDKVIYYLK